MVRWLMVAGSPTAGGLGGYLTNGTSTDAEQRGAGQAERGAGVVAGAQPAAQQGVRGGEQPAHGDAVQGGGQEQAALLAGAG